MGQQVDSSDCVLLRAASLLISTASTSTSKGSSTSISKHVKIDSSAETLEILSVFKVSREKGSCKGEGFKEEGFREEGFKEEGFKGEGFKEEGFNGKGFKEGGFKEEGIEEQGFEEQGFKEQGFKGSRIQETRVQLQGRRVH